MRVVTTKIICVLVLLAVWSNLQTVASQPAARRRVLHYEPEKVTLKGKVVSRTFYGPPNYGENPKTDSRESQYILILDSAVYVFETCNDTTDQTMLGGRHGTLIVNK